jgi:hypothetical protein
MKVYLAENMDYLGFLTGGIMRTAEFLLPLVRKGYAIIHSS